MKLRLAIAMQVETENKFHQVKLQNVSTGTLEYDGFAIEEFPIFDSEGFDLGPAPDYGFSFGNEFDAGADDTIIVTGTKPRSPAGGAGPGHWTGGGQDPVSEPDPSQFPFGDSDDDERGGNDLGPSREIDVPGSGEAVYRTAANAARAAMEALAEAERATGNEYGFDIWRASNGRYGYGNAHTNDTPDIVQGSAGGWDQPGILVASVHSNRGVSDLSDYRPSSSDSASATATHIVFVFGDDGSLWRVAGTGSEFVRVQN